MKSFSPEVSDEVFCLFADIVYRASGIRLTPAKKGLLISRLLGRLKRLGVKDFDEYYKLVSRDAGELVEMLNCVSTHTTKFFREDYHFDYLTNVVLPGLLSRKKERAIRIWSAGCSTGEEAYSIAVSALEALRFHNAGDWDLKILATDISTKALDGGIVGIYGQEQLPVDLPREITARYFLKGAGENEGKIRVKDFVREAVRFRRLNLKDTTYPFTRLFDAIFCRNVMIYFDEDMKRHAFAMFERHLAASGHLFLGHSEMMFDRKTFTPVFITVYRKTMQ